MLLKSCDPNDREGSMKLVEDLTMNANQVQKQILHEILTQNADTEYLRGFLGSGDSFHRELFKKRVPIVNYDDIKPYIERIANGEPSQIISAQPISELLTSSGTSGGQPKLMPSTAEDLDRKTFLYNLLVPVMNQFNVYTSPDETILCPDNQQSMYCQLLCGLIQREEVLRVGAVFASALLRAIKFIEDNWQELCSNIRTGHVSDWITDSICRNAVLNILRQHNPELADLIESECKAKSWEGIIKRLWPRTKYVDVIVTGSMAQYVSTLDFYSGGLPLVSTMYASSECYFGINLNPLSEPSNVSYTLLPNMAYFEFLPVNKKHGEEGERDTCDVSSEMNCSKKEDKEVGEEKGEAVDLIQVEPGHYYELIVTTFSGLYRYRVGDILMVTGFHNNAPQFRFVHRQNVVLSIDTDKTNEDDLLMAVTEAKQLLDPLGFLLTEYTSYADTSSIPGHYVLFWELKSRRGNPDQKLPEMDRNVMEECCYTVEQSLDYVYRRCRSKDKSIGALEIRVVRQGTFDALMDFCVSQGSSVNQYKTPRCVKSGEAIEILDSRVVGRFMTKRIPFWEPYGIDTIS
ncbi:indole-3-acetic acid-amido synthetase GH3.17-like isoform X2 [Macadamia integrifolia]|uniref:indole-3-acetic acid-amido synthetase GH3.17-like isoform X2 n=1 Tax=Macadamia integrifolia TaxID=60698 RepID=UPI001C4E6176|nr:indole-3-acetic acid-amido synthetase GH3.17-like isoform X2 [Macadamia integrifolia]